MTAWWVGGWGSAKSWDLRFGIRRKLGLKSYVSTPEHGTSSGPFPTEWKFDPTERYFVNAIIASTVCIPQRFGSFDR